MSPLLNNEDKARIREFADADYQAQFTTHFINAFGVWTAADLDHIGRSAARRSPSPGSRPVRGRRPSWVAPSAACSTSRRSTSSRPSPGVWPHGGRGQRPVAHPDPHRTTAPPWGSSGSTPENPLNGLSGSAPIVQFTAPFNATGQPAISLPLPLERQWTAHRGATRRAYGREDLLLQVAAQLEQAEPWARGSAGARLTPTRGAEAPPASRVRRTARRRLGTWRCGCRPEVDGVVFRDVGSEVRGSAEVDGEADRERGVKLKAGAGRGRWGGARGRRAGGQPRSMVRRGVKRASTI